MGLTPMHTALTHIYTLVNDWCSKQENRNSFPPIVFNISDGEASDADYEMLRSAAKRLKEISTNDGNTLFINVHISSNTDQEAIIFPVVSEIQSSVRYARLLMDMSSIIPEQFNHYVGGCRENYASPPYVAMSYNASISELIAMLNIGARTLVLGT